MGISNGMKRILTLRMLIVLLIHVCVALTLLFWEFPWSVYYQDFTFGFEVTVWSYVAASLLVGLLSVSVPLMVEAAFPRNVWGFRQVVLCFMLASLIFGVLCVALGPLGFDLLSLRIRGIFFSEWKFVSFFVVVGLPLALLGGVTGKFLFAQDGTQEL
jgi:hypothetical protein